MAFIFEGANFKRNMPTKQGFKGKKGGNNHFILYLRLSAQKSDASRAIDEPLLAEKYRQKSLTRRPPLTRIAKQLF